MSSHIDSQPSPPDNARLLPYTKENKGVSLSTRQNVYTKNIRSSSLFAAT